MYQDTLLPLLSSPVVLLHGGVSARQGVSVSEEQSWISGEELTRAVLRSTRTKTQIAKDIGVTRTYLFKLMEVGVSDPARVETVRREMALWLDYDPYGSFSDEELAAEIVRRLGEYRGVDPTPKGKNVSTGSQSSEPTASVTSPPRKGGISGTLGEGAPIAVNGDGG